MKNNQRSIYQPQVHQIFADMKIGRATGKHHSQDRLGTSSTSPSAATEVARASRDTGAVSYAEVVQKMLADARAVAQRNA